MSTVAARLRLTAGRRPDAREVAGLVLSALPIAVGVTAAVYAFTQLWYLELTPTLDDLGLLNPIYMFLHTGSVTYPIYPAVDSAKIAYVHPPGDPILVAAAMWLTGWPAMAAAVALILLVLFVAFGLSVFSRFSMPTKLAFVIGPYVMLVRWAIPTYIRPDLRLAGAWIAGLVALETARLAGWKRGRLLLGAFLLALVPTLHYPGSPSVLTIAIYGIWAARDLGWRRARGAIAALGVGAAVVLVPYLALFVLPWYHDIVSFGTSTNSAGGGILGAIRLHREMYHLIDRQNRMGGWLVHDLALPFTRYGIPVVVFTTPVFALRRETRGIAIGSLPSLLFMLFFVHTKNAGNLDYYLPEFILYYAAVVYLALLVLDRLAGVAAGRLRTLGAARPLAVCAAGAVLLFFCATRGPATYLAYGAPDHRATHAEMELARAVTEASLPPNALVLNNSSLGLWYITGGTRVYPLWRDLAYAPDYSTYNIPAYLRGFTAIAGGEAAAWDTYAVYNKQRQGVSSWYAAGILKPYRFYWGDTRTANLRFVLLSARREDVEGNVLRGGRTMEHYVESPGGAYVLVSAVCPVRSRLVTSLPGNLHAPMFLPGPSPANVDPYVDAAAGVRRLAVQTFLATRGEWRSRWRSVAAADGCTVRDLVPLRIASRTPVSQVLAGWHDRAISFPAFVAATNALYAPTGPTAPVGSPVDLSRLRAAGTATRSPRGVRISGPSQLYAEIARVAISLPRSGRAWVVVRGTVSRGKLDLCLLARGSCAIRRSVAAPAAGIFYVPVPSALGRQGGVSLYLQNEEPGPPQVELDSVRVLRATR